MPESKSGPICKIRQMAKTGSANTGSAKSAICRIGPPKSAKIQQMADRVGPTNCGFCRIGPPKSAKWSNGQSVLFCTGPNFPNECPKKNQIPEKVQGPVLASFCYTPLFPHPPLRLPDGWGVVLELRELPSILKELCFHISKN